MTFALENLLNFLDDDKGIIEYGYYSGRVPIIDLRIVDGDKYDYSGNAYDIVLVIHLILIDRQLRVYGERL